MKEEDVFFTLIEVITKAKDAGMNQREILSATKQVIADLESCLPNEKDIGSA